LKETLPHSKTQQSHQPPSVVQVFVIDDCCQSIGDKVGQFGEEAVCKCLECLRNNSKNELSFHHFTEEDLQNTAVKGESVIVCPLCNKTIKIEDLAPDLVMVYFNGPKVKAEELVFEEVVGCGGFASVWKVISTAIA